MSDWLQLAIAVRAHTVRTTTRAKARRRKLVHEIENWRTSWPDFSLVIDCETTTDPSQRLTFGWYRVLEEDRLVEEGIFTADDLSERDRQVIEAYAAKQRQDTTAGEPVRVLT